METGDYRMHMHTLCFQMQKLKTYPNRGLVEITACFDPELGPIMFHTHLVQGFIHKAINPVNP